MFPSALCSAWQPGRPWGRRAHSQSNQETTPTESGRLSTTMDAGAGHRPLSCYTHMLSQPWQAPKSELTTTTEIFYTPSFVNCLKTINRNAPNFCLDRGTRTENPIRSLLPRSVPQFNAMGNRIKRMATESLETRGEVWAEEHVLADRHKIQLHVSTCLTCKGTCVLGG